MHDLTEQSRTTHGAITEHSHREGKGGEGSKEGKGVGHFAFPTHLAPAPQCGASQ